MALVSVTEGMCLTIRETDTFKFPAMNSCLGIICYLSNNQKVGAHFVMGVTPPPLERPEGQQTVSLRAALAAQHSHVYEVKVFGNIDVWAVQNLEIESMEASLMREPGPQFAGNLLQAGEAQLAWFEQNRSILGNQNVAAQALARLLDCDPGVITFKKQAHKKSNFYEEGGSLREESSA